MHLQLVEWQHGVRLDPACPACDVAGPGLVPWDEVRIKTADITEEKAVRVGQNGRVEEHTNMRFLHRPDRIVPDIYMEWLRKDELCRGVDRAVLSTV